MDAFVNALFLVALAIFVPWFIFGWGVEVGKRRAQSERERYREDQVEANRKERESSEAVRLREAVFTEKRPAQVSAEKQPKQIDRPLIDPPTDDVELLRALRIAAMNANYPPRSFIEFGATWADWQRRAVNQPFGPYPRLIDEAEILSESFEAWPEWVADLAPVGTKWERLHWPDGSLTIRLVTPRALVLAAVHLPIEGKRPD